MQVLILSKTKYGQSQYCIGGLTSKNKFVRLLNPGGSYQPINTKLNIGDIWDISFTLVTNIKEPHNEDVIVHNKRFVKRLYNIKTTLKSRPVKIWTGSIYNIFDGNLKWTEAGSGYLAENQYNMPQNSVGFWIPDEDLRFNNGYYYFGDKKLNYKGATSPDPVIPKGSLVRLSLAKWWQPEGLYEARCYLQLSGVYNDSPQIINKPKVSSSVNSPKNTSGGCYIATVCYGSYDADEVCEFRNFRDFTLNNYILGRAFIRLYYRYSPSISSKIKPYKKLNNGIRRLILNPLLTIIKTLELDKMETPEK